MVSTGQIILFREHDQNGPALYFIVIFMVNGILERHLWLASGKSDSR